MIGIKITKIYKNYIKSADKIYLCMLLFLKLKGEKL